MVKPRRISDFKPLLTNLAQTSHYQVMFGGLPFPLRQHLDVRGINWRFIAEESGLLCSSAVLPGSAFSSLTIEGNYMGVQEKMAHTRLFTEIQLEFYVDRDYKTIKFLEHWIEFIASGSGENPAQDGYYFRMAYPDEYKTSQTKIVKFDRDYKEELEYTFFGLFPRALNDTPVSYGTSDLLKATATFSFDRYVCGRASSFSVWGRNHNNLKESKKVIPSGRGSERRDSSRPKKVKSQTQLMVERDNRVYGNTFPAGSFGITTKKSSITRDLQGFKDDPGEKGDPYQQFFP